MRRFIIKALVAAVAALLAGAAPAADSDALWKRLRAGHLVLLVRHAATEPGAGDPPGFKLGNCGTQRNLSALGRADAEAIGTAMREHRVPVGPVLTSRWCRCIETATLAFVHADQMPMLDSVMGDSAKARDRKLAEVRQFVAQYVVAQKEPGNLVLVTHDVNIRALVGETIAQGEMVVAAPQPDGGLKVLGKLGVPRAGDAGRKM